MYDQDAMIEVVAFEPLWWDPGADLGYGATPYGWMCALGCKRRISSHCEFRTGARAHRGFLCARLAPRVVMLDEP
ncbi:hypothetical protein AWM69_14520 [Pseudomonas sp. D1HM]|nr:hypothetical protein [Pseudomonas sp. D1HM]MBW0237173.1 hypothetical protein [Pseudomonas sp. D1HM]